MNRTKQDIIDALVTPGIIAVVRAQKPEQVPPLTEALLAGGVLAIEITMTTPNAIEAIRKAHQEVGDRALIGVGTVLDARTCSDALEAGAQFVVTPICRPEFVPLCHKYGRPVMLGAYSPTEAQNAYEAGADFVKIFPADTLGPAYIKAIKTPLPHLKIVPTGGVDVHNVAEFLKVGCSALGVGGSLVSARILQEGNWPELTRKAAEFVQAAKGAKRA